MNLSVRKARMGDIRAIHALLMTSSADGLLLPRSLTDLYGHLRDFFVVEGDGATVGCGALSIIWENMAEVRSLAVAAHARRKGCGRLIVEACIAEARELDIHRLFALTYQLPFFNALGFSIVEKEVLPQKVWVDCVNCPKIPGLRRNGGPAGNLTRLAGRCRPRRSLLHAYYESQTSDQRRSHPDARQGNGRRDQHTL